MTYRLRRRESMEVALRRIAVEQIDAMLEDAGRHDAPGHVAHAIRKRCKKLRALLRLVRGAFGDYADGERAVRGVARLLAPAREAAARIDTLEQLRERDDGLGQDDADALCAWLDASRTNRLDALANEEVRAAVRLALRELRDRVPGWTLDKTGFDAVRDGLARTYRRGRDALRHAGSTPTPDCLHELRKRVKYHRFHLGLLRGAWRGPLSASSEEARRLGDVLGDHHDAAVLIDSLRAQIGDADISAPAARAVPLLEARMRELEREALPLATRLFAEKPRAFERRMHAYWRAWRPDGRA
jgi:CHAD domain-containing protein